MQGPMPSTDGAIGLGLAGTICLLKVLGLSGPRLDAKTSERPCGAPLPSLRASLCAPQHASGAEALTPPSRMRNTANLLGWSDWIVGPPRRSRIDLSCHQTRAVSQTAVSPRSAMRWCGTAVGQRWEEGEGAYRKPRAAAPSCSVPSPAMMSGSHGSSCDDASTPRGQHGGWTGTGETGVIGRRSTPAGS